MSVKTVFFDVDTQLDFLLPAGALAVPGAAEIAQALADLTRYALSSETVILSTMDAHAENDEEFQVWKPHCVVGTQGQAKFTPTLSSKAAVIDTGYLSPGELASVVSSAPQVVVEKQTIDVFLSQHLHSVLDLLGAQRFVVYGLVTEYCVGSAVLGLLARGAEVEVVTDAVQGIDAAAEREMFESFQKKGARLTKVSEILRGAPQLATA